MVRLGEVRRVIVLAGMPQTRGFFRERSWPILDSSARAALHGHRRLKGIHTRGKFGRHLSLGFTAYSR